MLFLRQLWALCLKNALVLKTHWFLNIIRCFVAPVAYGVFIGVAQLFLIRPNNLGIGSPAPILSFASTFDSDLTFIWADGTNGTGFPRPADIISHIAADFSSAQLANILQVDSPSVIPDHCPQNYQGFSTCWAAVAFNSMPTSAADPSPPINYTIRGDAGLTYVDVSNQASDFEQRILPLQWAIDSAIIELRTGSKPPVPREWPFTQATNEDQARDIRLAFIGGVQDILVLALFIAFVGVNYHVAGSFMLERATLLTSHLKVMGLLDSARIMSWHLSMSVAYLPAWVIIALVWRFRIFSQTNAGIIIVIHILTGFVCTSWSMFVATPFGKSPQLAAIGAVFFSVVVAILAMLVKATSGSAILFTIIFPPTFYIFAIRGVSSFEQRLQGANLVRGDPDHNLRIIIILVITLINIVLYPVLTAWLEHYLYDAKEPPRGLWARLTRRPVPPATVDNTPPPPDTAISVRNINKTFDTSSLFRRNEVTAIESLSLDIPRTGIFVLLGGNGAGKSTFLSILAGLLGRTSGTVTFDGGHARPARGTLGIVPQKNVLFPELTCYQTVRLWSAIKRTDKGTGSSETRGDLIQLLRDCDLGKKIHKDAGSLSGGQKRKLQLAIGLVGGSSIVLVDEATSGVDPLSRRSLWQILTSVRHERTIVFTTHFLDEADLLGDHVAVLAAPGKLLTEGSPVSLKSSRGEGYAVSVKFEHHDKAAEGIHPAQTLLAQIHTIAPQARCTAWTALGADYALKLKDPRLVQQVLELLEQEKSNHRLTAYDVHGSSLEEIFISLMKSDDLASEGMLETKDVGDRIHTPNVPAMPTKLALADGRRTSVFSQAWTIFRKRLLVARRSWLSPLIMVVIGICAICIPLFWLKDLPQTCAVIFRFVPTRALWLPQSQFFNQTVAFFDPASQPVVAPPNLLTNNLPMLDFGTLRIHPAANEAAFVDTINTYYRDLRFGGLSVDPNTRNVLIAWEATLPSTSGPTLLNMASNILLRSATGIPPTQNTSLILGNYQSFPRRSGIQLLALKWFAFFGLAVAVFPAFYTLYVTKERRSSVQAMQYSNGLSNPAGLWLGHWLFDAIPGTLITVIAIIIIATVQEKDQFHFAAYFWLCLFLYALCSSLFSYCVSLFAPSALAAFAIVAGYQVVVFLLYLAAYLLTLTYAKSTVTDKDLTIIHYTLSLLTPVASVTRAALVSTNVFSLLCDGDDFSNDPAGMRRFGSPIVYLIVYGLILFGILVYVDSGAPWPSFLSISYVRNRRWRRQAADPNAPAPSADVIAEAEQVEHSEDPLRVSHVSKTFPNGTKAVDDVSLGVGADTVFAMLGPNGAGKTSTFNIIRGDIRPDEGDVFINGASITHHSNRARLGLGVCPQFNPMDSQLTVREHLVVYGRLKGLRDGEELQNSVQTLIDSTALSAYADRLASKLSGGNQRKLSLAIALIGNPSVILIDEFSTGIAPDTKRNMWVTLRNVVHGKAVVITTHSMEEATALSNKVGILAGRMLAVGTTASLASRYAAYEVHFSCRTREETARAQALMARIPGSRMAEDVATRFEVPFDENRSLAQLFKTLSEQEGEDRLEFSVDQVSLESVFLKVIREHNIREEGDHERRAGEKRKMWRIC